MSSLAEQTALRLVFEEGRAETDEQSLDAMKVRLGITYKVSLSMDDGRIAPNVFPMKVTHVCVLPCVIFRDNVPMCELLSTL